MRLPVFKYLQKELSEEQMETAMQVLETYSEAPTVKEEELEVIGEMISNLSGAIEMQKMVKEGMSEKDAANAFMKRVMGSIDR